MSKLTVDHDFFSSRAEVMQDIARTGFWPTTYVSPGSPELPLHYHNYDIIGYVMSGTTYVLDEEKNRIAIGAGDRLNIPKGAWHAEGAVVDQVTYIVTISDAIPFMQALLPMEPQGPFPEGMSLGSA